MTSFDWLHISDLHFGHGDASYGHDQALVLQSLADDAINQVDNSEVPRPQAIFVTGDIANSGDARGLDEYELAASWLTDLADRLAVPTGSIYCVPGNHDVNRSAAKSDEVLKWVLQACRLGAGVDEALDSPASRSALAKSFESYSRFLTSHASPACLGADGTGLCWQTELPLTEQFTLRLVGINTALLSADDTDEGKLQVGKHQLREAFTPAPGTDTVTLVLSHHPFSWLADSTQVSGWVEKHADIHLVGHLHEQRSSTSRTGGRNELTVLAAGAAHGDDAAPHQHGYNFGRVEIGDDNRGTIRMWPRIWSDKAKSFTLDAENVDEDEGTSASHAMRKRFSPRNVEDQSRIRTVARTALEALGSGSTAFPRDLSVRELSAEGLIVPPKVISPTSTLDVSDIAVELESGRSVLLLGEPGAGKTVLVYSVCERLLSGGTRAPLVISVASVAGKAIDAASVAAAVVTPDGQPVLPADITRDGVVIIADGIDEALASGSAARDVGAVLAGLPSVAPSLVACRRLEFDDQLSSRVGNDRYLACSVAPWRVEVEFADFIRRLTEAGRLSSTDLVARISGSSEMRGLVARPLYARMLTAVLSEIGDLDVSDTAALYANYLHSLANTVEARLARTGCEDANVYAGGDTSQFGDAQSQSCSSNQSNDPDSPCPSGSATTVAGAGAPFSDSKGYYETDTVGNVWAYGSGAFWQGPGGDLPELGVHVSNIVGMAVTKDGGGYWLVGSDGGVFAFGDASFEGSCPAAQPPPDGCKGVNDIVGMVATPDNGGYWLVGSDGGVFAFGGAQFYGNGIGRLGSGCEAVGLASTWEGNALWMLDNCDNLISINGPNGLADHFSDSCGSSNVMGGISPARSGRGYFLWSSVGNLFACGYDAPWRGSDANKGFTEAGFVITS